MSELTIPAKLETIVKALYADSEQAAKMLIIQAAKAIYGTEDADDYLSNFGKRNHVITPQELEEICILMRGINPQDTFEALLAAQIIVSHLLGLRKLSKDHISDTQLGIKLLRFSSDAMNQLQKKRCGCTQNIFVTYNQNGSGPSLVQTILPDTRGANANKRS